ncbi:MAG: ATP-binding cassette domain-containing protein, partial [Chloroflexi bacterium]|nr:ATP-binding cassette domain-containing protein [Chloroflexota bacterium]
MSTGGHCEIAVSLRGLTRTFERPDLGVPVRGLRRFWTRRPTMEAVALHPTTFHVNAGESVAFIGPNGAGKSTTIKILTGILHPTAGMATVLGHVPWLDRDALSREIATVFGQKSQLWYHLPARDSFTLLTRIHDLDADLARRRAGALCERFGLDGLLDRPVRTLSLGERMRCEVAAALLHSPRILFLDEPTIVFLTSHDAGDVERVCDRAIVIHTGRVVFDGSIETLRRDFVRRKTISLELSSPFTGESPIMSGVVSTQLTPMRWQFQVDTTVVPAETVLAGLIGRMQIADLTITDPPME